MGRARVLVLRALGLGDLLTAIPALRGLRAAFPDHSIELALPRALHELALSTKALDRTIAVGELEPLPPSVYGPAVAVNLHGKGPQSHRLLLRTKPAAMLAFRNDEAGCVEGPVWNAQEHERQRWCGLLAAFGIEADPNDFALSLDALDLEAWSSALGATVLHPGAASAARRWPLDRFAAVAKSEMAAGRKVIVTGSAAERDLALRLVASAQLSPDACLAGRTSVMELAAVIAGAGRVVCGDTGVAHLASALRTPSVVLFGPTSPATWGPPRGPHIALWSGRRGDPHADRADPGLLEIEVDAVLAALRWLEALQDRFPPSDCQGRANRRTEEEAVQFGRRGVHKVRSSKVDETA